MRFFLCFSYNGSKYHGSQFQPNGITIQQVLEERLTLFLRTPIVITLSGRTDSGVNAEKMWAHFDFTPRSSDFYERGVFFVNRINAFLPSDITVLHFFITEDTAHARFSAIKRTYEYRIVLKKNSFYDRFFPCITQPLDVEKMNVASQILVGRHDFASFCKKHSDVNNTLCTVYNTRWGYKSLIDETVVLVFHIEANRFLRNMVRAIVGVMLDIGKNKTSINDFERNFFSGSDYQFGHSAPAHGLFLTHIEYPRHIFIKQFF